MAILTFLAGLLAIALNGAAMSILWEWFIVSAFSVPTITIAQGIGITFLVNFLVKRPTLEDYKNTILRNALMDKDAELLKENMNYSTQLALGWPIMSVLLGWIITWFM